MIGRHVTFKGQKWYLRPMQQLGYDIPTEGGCYGMTGLIAEVFALEGVPGLNVLNAIFIQIQKMPLSAFAPEHFNEEMKKNPDYPRFKAVFDQVNLYFHSFKEEYTALFEAGKQPLRQEIAETSRVFIQPAVIKDERGEIVEEVHTDILAKPCAPITDVYTPSSLMKYLQSLRETQASKPRFTYPVSVVLRHLNHAMMIGYDNGWYIGNPNRLPIKRIQSDRELAALIHAAFTKNTYAIFSTEIYVAATFKDEAAQALTNWQQEVGWQKAHAVTQEKVQATDSHKASWLYHAVKHRQPALIKKLIKQGAKTNGVTDTGIGLMYLAVQTKHLETIQALLSANNIEVNAPYKEITPLFYAVTNELHEIVNALLQHGANPDQACEGKTPLALAVENADIAMVTLLLKHGAEVDKPGEKGMTPLLTAVLNNDTQMIDTLLAGGADANQSDVDGFSPFLVAVENGNIDLVQRFLEKKADSNQTEKSKGMTPLMLAARSGQHEMVKLLLANGADPMLKDHDGGSALDVAVNEEIKAAILQSISHVEMLKQKRLQALRHDIHALRTQAAYTGNRRFAVDKVWALSRETDSPAKLEKALSNLRKLDAFVHRQEIKIGNAAHLNGALQLLIYAAYESFVPSSPVEEKLRELTRDSNDLIRIFSQRSEEDGRDLAVERILQTAAEKNSTDYLLREMHKFQNVEVYIQELKIISPREELKDLTKIIQQAYKNIANGMPYKQIMTQLKVGASQLGEKKSGLVSSLGLFLSGEKSALDDVREALKKADDRMQVKAGGKKAK